MVEVEGGSWRAQMMTNEAAGSFVLHTDTLHTEAAQATLVEAACAEPHAIAGPGLAMKVEDSPSSDMGPH